jgi:hypothetical protein
MRVTIIALVAILACLGATSALADENQGRRGTPTASVCEAGEVSSQLHVNKKALAQLEHGETLGAPTQQRPGEPCEVTISIERDADAPINPDEPCTFQVTSKPTHNGAEARIEREGDCDGVALRGTITPGEPTVRAVSPKRDARIVLWDIADYPMFINHVDLQIWYDGVGVYNYWWQRGNVHGGFGNFYLVSSTAQAYPESGWASVYAYNYARWYSCGFPGCGSTDVDARTQPSVRGYGSGSMSCYFWESIQGNVYLLDTSWHCYNW